MTRLTSCAGSVEFGQGLPTLLISDQLRVFDQDPGVLAELQLGRVERMLDLARRGKQAGIDVVDILVASPELDETWLLPRIAARVHEETGCFISLDSRDPEALKAALRVLRPYKALINSVNADQEVLDQILPIAAEFGAAVVGMPLFSDRPIPRTVEARLAGAEAILEAARQYGIPKEDVVLDAVCMAAASEPDSLRVTLETLSAFEKELGVATILGISNAGFGMPTPAFIDLAYLLAAAPWGLHAALVNPAIPGLIEATLAVDFLMDRDPYGKRYLRHYRAMKKNQKGG